MPGLSLGLGINLSSGAGTNPGIAAVLPTSLDGSNGNGGFPSCSQGQGPSANILATGAVITDGSQVVYLHNRYTGALLDTIVVRAVDAKDDHNNSGVVSYSNGAFLCAASGHNASNTVNMVYRAPDGTKTAFTLTYSGTMTYPRLYVDKNGVTWLFIREDNTNWTYRKCTDVHTSTSFAAKVVFADDADQLYFIPRYDPVTHLFYWSIFPNSSDPDFGKLKIGTFNPVNNEFRDGSGVLTLPFSFGGVATFSTPTAGRQLSGQINNDGQSMLLMDILTADTTDVDVYLWKFTGANWFAEADWTKSAILYSDPGQLSALSGYNPGRAWATEPHTGFRFYTSRKLNYANAVSGSGTRPVWAMECWDNPSGDLSTWTVTKLARHVAQTSMIVRATCYENASDNYMPITFVRYGSYSNYDSYTNARIEWCVPWKGNESIRFETEAETYFAKLTTPASALFKNQLNAMYRSINDLGMTARMGVCFITATETQEQREISLYGNFTLSGPSKPPFVARSSITFNSPYYYVTSVVPGTNLMTVAAHHLFVIVAANVQGNPDLGTSQLLINSRTATDNLSSRSSSTTSNNTALSASPGRIVGLRRAGTTTYSRYTATAGAAVSQSQASDASFNGQKIIWGGFNNGSDLPNSYSGRANWGWYGGDGLAASTDNTPLDIHVECLIALLAGETS